MASKIPEKYCPKPKMGSVPLYQFDRQKPELWKSHEHMSGSAVAPSEMKLAWDSFSNIFLTVPELIR